MKKLVIVFIAILAMAIPGQVNAQADAISKYFEKYVDDEDFTVVYVSQKMFEMFAKIAPDDEDMEEVRQVIKDLKGLRILVRDEAGGMKFYKEATKKINIKGYDELMTVKSDGSNIKFMVKDSGDIIEELLLIVGSESEFVLMSFVGKIDLEKISKLSKSVDINGLDHLEELEKDKKKQSQE